VYHSPNRPFGPSQTMRRPWLLLYTTNTQMLSSRSRKRCEGVCWIWILVSSSDASRGPKRGWLSSERRCLPRRPNNGDTVSSLTGAEAIYIITQTASRLQA
jgi:hypothetical protein